MAKRSNKVKFSRIKSAKDIKGKRISPNTIAVDDAVDITLDGLKSI